MVAQMSAPFRQSLQALSAERTSSIFAGLIIACCVSLAWIFWFIFAMITIYEQSDKARIVVDRSSYRVDSPVSGLVLSSNLILGRQVKVGELLVKLDNRLIRLEIQTLRSRLVNISEQIHLLKSQVASHESERLQLEDAAKAQMQEITTRAHHFEAIAQLGERDVHRGEKLLREGAISESELDKSRSGSLVGRDRADEARIQIERTGNEISARQDQLRANLAALNKDLKALEGERSTVISNTQLLNQKIELSNIRSPASGLIGEVMTIQPGMVLQTGEKVASVVPQRGLYIISEFPARTIGRVRPGQSARVRLDNFPWTQYGTVPATVQKIANEDDGGKVRVELSLHPRQHTNIHLEHGLSGIVEVEVEKVTPIVLVMRTAGHLIEGSKGAI